MFVEHGVSICRRQDALWPAWSCKLGGGTAGATVKGWRNKKLTTVLKLLGGRGVGL
jgi:hypothetical protein